MAVDLAPTVSVTQLLSRYSLTSESVDKECSEEHIRETARSLENWELVASYLGLTPAQIEEVKHDSKQDIRLMRLKVLEKWHSLCLYNATYRVLLEALLKSGNTERASLVCRLLNPHQTPLDMSTSHTDVPTSASNLSTTDVDTRLQPLAPSPSSELTESSEMKSQIDAFEDRFYNLRESALVELTKKGVTVETLRRTLILLPARLSHEHDHFLKSEFPHFKEAETVDEIFLHFNTYLSFIDFSLLEHIVEKLCSSEVKRQMARYSEDMKSFRTRTKIINVIQHLPQKSTTPKYFSKLDIELDIDITKWSLEDLDRYRKQCLSEFLLSNLALYLAKVTKGSLLLCWFVSSDVVPALEEFIRNQTDSFFSKLHILQLSLDEKCLFTSQPSTSTDEPVSATLSTPELTLPVIMMKTPKPEHSTETPASFMHTTETPEVTLPVSTMKKLEHSDETPASGNKVTLSRQRIADEISCTIESSSDSRGLAVIIGLSASRESEIPVCGPYLDSESMMQKILANFARTFETFTLSIFRRGLVSRREMDDIIYAASQLVHYPKSSDYTLVVIVGECGEYIRKPFHNINIGHDIVEPFLPPSAPNLADVRKIFLIKSFVHHSSFHSRTLDLSVSSKGNFLISHTCFSDPFWFEPGKYFGELDHQLRSVSIEEALTKASHPYHCEIVSHLEKPVYLHHSDVIKQPQLSGHEIALSRRRIAEVISSTIETTSDSQGLAVIVGLAASREQYPWSSFRDPEIMMLQSHKALARTCSNCKFSIFRRDLVSRREMDDIIYATSQLVHYPKSSDYTLVVIIGGCGEYIHRTINISRDIVEPFLPTSSPDLADIPKIFLVHSFTVSSHPHTLDLSVSSKGNFLISHTCFSDPFWFEPGKYFRELDHQLRSVSIEEALTKASHPYHCQIVSHLEKPVYLHHSDVLKQPQLSESTDASSTESIEKRFPSSPILRRQVPIPEAVLADERLESTPLSLSELIEGRLPILPGSSELTQEKAYTQKAHEGLRNKATLSRQRIADEISSTIESTPDSRGLAVVVGLSASRQSEKFGLRHPDPYHDYETMIQKSLGMLAQIFGRSNFSIFRQDHVLPGEMDDIIYATSQLVHYPKSSDYTLVVIIGEWVEYSHMYLPKINITRDIVEPFLSSSPGFLHPSSPYTFLPPSTPDLAEIPKIFLINFFSKSLFKQGPLGNIFSPEGSFLISYTCFKDNPFTHFKEYFRVLDHQLHLRNVSIEDALRKAGHPRHSQIVSHLKKPIYLYPGRTQKQPELSGKVLPVSSQEEANTPEGSKLTSDVETSEEERPPTSRSRCMLA